MMIRINLSSYIASVRNLLLLLAILDLSMFPYLTSRSYSVNTCSLYIVHVINSNEIPKHAIIIQHPPPVDL